MLIAHPAYSLQIGELKAKIEERDGKRAVDRQRILHDGQILSNNVTIASTGVTEVLPPLLCFRPQGEK
jgi:hypothetical protein